LKICKQAERRNEIIVYIRMYMYGCEVKLGPAQGEWGKIIIKAHCNLDALWSEL